MVKRVQSDLAKAKAWAKAGKKNGALGLALLCNAIVRAVEGKHGTAESRDSTVLLFFVHSHKGEESIDAKDKALMLKVAKACIGGECKIDVTSDKAKKQPTGALLRLADNAGYTEKMAELRDLVDKGASLRGAAVAEAFANGKSPGDFDLDKYLKTVRKTLEKHNVDAAVAARLLQAVNL
jgi:hypothetical protein